MENKNAMQRLNHLILQKNSRICAGLDPVWDNMPKRYRMALEDLRMGAEDVMFQYCCSYIDAVKKICPAIKINSAFFEREGYEDMFFDIAKIAKDEGLFVIGDIKRADIGDTSEVYAEAYLKEDSPFDAVTVNPYFGTDGVMPFLKMAKENGKGVFILVKTSNKSSAEIQNLELNDGRKVYEAVADLVTTWANEVDPKNFNNYPMVGAVVGATQPKQAQEIIKRLGKTMLLIPGYGFQGATVDDIAGNFDPQGLGAIVNSSRAIMHAYKKLKWCDQDWTVASYKEAEKAKNEINKAINRFYEITVC